MDGVHERWEKIHPRLRKLQHANQEEEAEILMAAYDMLLLAYGEARELNEEMELLIRDTLKG